MSTQFLDLPNLNFGLTVKQLNCVIHPTITPNVLDHYLRKPADQDIVVGVLLGTIDGSRIDIYSSFAVPQYYDKEQKDLVTDNEFIQKMLKFHRKVNPNEGLLGMYISSKKLDHHGLKLLQYFNDLFQIERKRALISFPLVMMVDPTLSENKLSIKILNLVSGFLKNNPILCELSYSFAIDNYQKTGLDVLFYGQEHFDTLAILSRHEELKNEQVSDLMKNQKLFSNKELMIKNLKKICFHLDECEKYIHDIEGGKVKPDPEIIKSLNQCISQFSSDDMQILESMIQENFQEAVILNTLAKLQHIHITMTEKLNNIFTQSINKQPIKQQYQPRERKESESQSKQPAKQ